MKRQSIYELYGCKDKEELYNKVKNKDNSVLSLIEFIEFSKANRQNEKQLLNSPGACVNYFLKMSPIKEGEMRVVFTDTQLEPIHLSIVNSKTAGIKSILKDGILAGASGAFINYPTGYNNIIIKQLEDRLNFIGIKVNDKFSYDVDKSKFYSFAENGREVKNSVKEGDLVQYNFFSKIKDEDFLTNLSGYEEFMEYFATYQIKDLNVVINRNKLIDNMKVAFQHKEREVFGLISYDKLKNIKALNVLFKGNISSAGVDFRLIFKDLIKNEADGFIIFHNHPSGVNTPSAADIGLTHKIGEIADYLDIKFSDHLIIGKEGVYSFIENDLFQSPFGKINFNDRVYKEASLSMLKDSKDDLPFQLDSTLPTEENLKNAIMSFLSKENDNEMLKQVIFNDLFPDRSKITLYKSGTDNSKKADNKNIAISLDLTNQERPVLVTYVDDIAYCQKTIEVEDLLSLLSKASGQDLFNFTIIDNRENLQSKYINEKTQIYDPLSQDMDGDGIIDRYDNDFRDSDYFESTYDVEDNLHQKESTIEKLDYYKEKIRSQEEHTKNQELECNDIKPCNDKSELYL